jgi:hypothetical protein
VREDDGFGTATSIDSRTLLVIASALASLKDVIGEVPCPPGIAQFLLDQRRAAVTTVDVSSRKHMAIQDDEQRDVSNLAELVAPN